MGNLMKTTEEQEGEDGADAVGGEIGKRAPAAHVHELLGNFDDAAEGNYCPDEEPRGSCGSSSAPPNVEISAEIEAAEHDCVYNLVSMLPKLYVVVG